MNTVEVAPYLWEIDNILSKKECSLIIDTAKPLLERSTVIENSKLEGSKVDDVRTSSGAHFFKDMKYTLEFDMVRRKIEYAISEFTKLPIENQEGLQVLHYDVDEEYKAHHDFFVKNTEYWRGQIQNGGQRMFSFLLYLNQPEEGGETEYPQLNKMVAPSPGKVCMHQNVVDGKEYFKSEHAALPVKKGEKWVLVTWIREGEFGKPLEKEAQKIVENKFSKEVKTTPTYIVDRNERIKKLVPVFTKDGYKKRKVPKKLFSKILNFYEQNKSNIIEENIPGDYLETISENLPSTTLTIIDQYLSKYILDELQEMHEKWSGLKLKAAAAYGIRNYLRGSYLHCHLDRVETHIISCIINVAQKVDKKWPLHIEDHNGKMHKIGLNPGEMIFYESCKLLHGRPDPLEGDFYSSIFVHYTPVDWDIVE